MKQLLIIVLSSSIAIADYRDPEMPTQRNEQTNLFQESVEDFANWQKDLESGKQKSVDSLGNSTPEGLSFITDKSKDQLGQESQKLESIKANDLNTRGREEMLKSDEIDNLYRDYSKAPNSILRHEAKSLADAQDSLLDNLLGSLKDIGIDCKTVKGDKVLEPEYYLQVKTTTHKDTKYNQVFCEDLRNQYSCMDSLNLKCINFTEEAAKFEVNKFTYSGFDYGVHGEAMKYGPLDNFYKHYHPSPGGKVSGDISVNNSHIKGWVKVEPKPVYKKSIFNMNIGSPLTIYQMSSIDFGAYDASEASLAFNLSLETEQDLIKVGNISGSFSGSVMIKVNGNIVYMAPCCGSDMHITNYWQQTQFRSAKKFRRSKHQLWRIVNIGGKNFTVQKQLIGNINFNGVNIKTYLKRGNNQIEIKSINSIGVYGSFDLNITQQKCLSWQENWIESCRLK